MPGWVTIAVVALASLIAALASWPAATPSRPADAPSALRSARLIASVTSGYWLVGADGAVFPYGAPSFGSDAGLRLNQPIVGMAASPGGLGYWLVARDGGVFSFGDARFHGSTGGMRLNSPIVGMAADPATGGYWLVAADGGVFSFGARFFGSTGGMRLNQPIVGMAASPDGLGYWLVARDGGVFSFGDARFHGSTGGMRLNQPIVGMAADPGAGGYWLVAADGGVFSFGARFYGSTGGMRLNQPIVGMAASPGGLGYWLVARDGGVFSFGDARFQGSTGAMKLSWPIIGILGHVAPPPGPGTPGTTIPPTTTSVPRESTTTSTLAPTTTSTSGSTTTLTTTSTATSSTTTTTSTTTSTTRPPTTATTTPSTTTTTGSGSAGYSFATSVSSNGRYLLDQFGHPYLVVGDAPQALIGNISLSDADSYFADRQAHGINAAWINLLCGTYTGCNASNSTFDGIAPFTTPDDISTPNPVYFQKVDDVLQLAAEHGITVFLDPAETGGFMYLLGVNGPAQDKAYGEYLANRYKNFPNIVWMMGNDFESWQTPADDALVTAIADGLRAGGDHHLMTIELNYNESLSTDDPNWASRVDINGAYSYYPTYDEVLKGYDNGPTKPVVFLEGHYDGECVGPGGCGSLIVLRRQEYWVMTSGAAGQLYGSQYWPFQSGWQTGIDSIGADQLQIMADFFGKLPWYQLVPNQDHSLVTAGYGTYDAGETGATESDDYVTAAETPDGTTAVIYLADTHTITVDLAKMSGAVTARWFDPTTGDYSAAGSFPNTGSVQFTSPADHSDGTDDWVLLLQAS